MVKPVTVSLNSKLAVNGAYTGFPELFDTVTIGLALSLIIWNGAEGLLIIPAGPVDLILIR